MSLLRSYSSYSRVEREDPEEVKHRKAQFLIYKVLERAQVPRGRPVSRMVAIRRFKIKIGAQLRSVRRSMRSAVSAAKARVCAHGKVSEKLRVWKRAICGRGGGVSLAPLIG